MGYWVKSGQSMPGPRSVPGPSLVVSLWLSALVAFSGSVARAGTAASAAAKTTVAVTAASVPSCRPLPLDFAGLGLRSRVVRFMDGREITVIGHDHGDRDAVGGAADTFRQINANSRSGPEFQQKISQLLAANPAAVSDAQIDAAFLRQFLANHTATFVAAEASPATVKTNEVSYRQVRQAYLASLRKFHLSASLFDDAQRLAFGADFFLRLSEPRLFARSEFVGVEDPALGQAFTSAMQPMAGLRQTLAQLQFDPQVSEKVSALFNSLPARYIGYRPEVDYDGILRDTRRSLTASDYAKIDSPLRLRLRLMNTMKARDRHDVAELLALKRSGVMTIGSDHLDSIAQLLKEACERKRFGSKQLSGG